MPHQLTREDLLQLRRWVRRHPDTIGRAGYLFDEICDAHEMEHGCIVRDETFAAYLGVSTRSVRTWLACLVELGVVRIEEAGGRRLIVPQRPPQCAPASGPNTGPQQANRTDGLEDNFRSQLPKSASKPEDNFQDLEDNFQKPLEDNFQHIENNIYPRRGVESRAREGKADSEGESEFGGPSLARCMEIGRQVMLPEVDVRQFWTHYEARGWEVRGSPIRSVKAAMMKWKQNRHKYDTDTDDSRNGHSQESTAEAFQRIYRLAQGA